MKQEIVIDSSVIRRIADPESLLNLRTYKVNLSNKKIVLDKNESESKLFEEYKVIYNHLTYESKLRVFAVLKKLLTIDESAIFISIKKDSDVFMNLLNSTKSKIGNSENVNHKLASIKGCEVHTIDEFCDPPATSRLLNWNRKIELKRGEEFKIHVILEPYFSQVSNLIIKDKYLLKNKISSKVFNLILSTCTDLKTAHIYSDLTDLKNEKKELERMHPNIKFDFYQSSNEQHDRGIILDELYIIKLSSGLDFVDNNSRVWRESSDIAIEEYKK